MFKQCLLTVMMSGLVFAASMSAVAQNKGGNDQPSAQAGEPPEHGHRHFDPVKRTEMLTRELKLSSDQQAKVLDILKSAQSQVESLRSDSSASQQDRRSKMMDIRKASDDQIRALLDSSQQKKFDAMQSRHEQSQGRRQGGTGSGAAGSSEPN